MEDKANFVQRWLDSNEEEATDVVESWLESHPQLLREITRKYQLAQQLQLSPYMAQSMRTHRAASLFPPPTASPLSPGLPRTPTLKHFQSSPNFNHRKPTRELRRLNKQDMFMELLRHVVSPDFDVNSISHKILVNVLLLTNADRSSLFLVEGCSKNPILVSRLFDVTEDSTVESAIHDETEAIKIPVGVGIVGAVASTGEKINLKDAYQVS